MAGEGTPGIVRFARRGPDLETEAVGFRTSSRAAGACISREGIEAAGSFGRFVVLVSALPGGPSRADAGIRGRGAAPRPLDLLPLTLLALAAAIHPLRAPVLVVLVAGFVVIRRREPNRAGAWAGAIPVAVSLAWGLLALPPSATDGSSCTDPLATFASWRLAEAFLSLATLAILVPLVGGGAGEIGLRRPTRSVGPLSVAAFLVCGPLGMILGPLFAEPFFGPIELATGDPAALIPALTFAISNGVMEEVIYRGSLRAWTARSTGPWVAIVGQAIVFGLAHGGPGFVGSPAPVIAAMTGGGLIAGWIVWRTGSLALPIAAHVGFDIPLYYGNACRLT